MSVLDPSATARTRARYDRLARFYDVVEAGNERWFVPMRADLWRRVRGPRVLEVGVGTGRNMPLYPPTTTVTAIDVSPRMLERAGRRAARLGATVMLQEADVQALPFPDGAFDTVVATFVFCSVPNPMLGLTELRRVLTPDGQLLLLEHVLSQKPVLRRAMRLVNPCVVRVMGANINRETVAAVERAGFANLRIEDRWLDVVKLIEGRTSTAFGVP